MEYNLVGMYFVGGVRALAVNSTGTDMMAVVITGLCRVDTAAETNFDWSDAVAAMGSIGAASEVTVASGGEVVVVVAVDFNRAGVVAAGDSIETDGVVTDICSGGIEFTAVAYLFGADATVACFGLASATGMLSFLCKAYLTKMAFSS